MTSHAIIAESLSVRASGRCVLDVADLVIRNQAITAVLGPNGAGKTTLLRACLGLVRPAQGTLRVLGAEVPQLRAGALARFRRRVGYVPQLLPAGNEMPLSVREVVAIGRTAQAGLLRRLRSEDWQLVDTWIERLGLSSLSEQAFSRLSGGEQRKTIIARAMAQQPELLILDEPTANLDLGWRERIVETIQQLHEETGLAIVLVCHELEVLPAACREVVLLDRGQVLAGGPADCVFTNERVAALYGSGLRVLHENGRHAVVPQGVTRV